MFDKEEFAIIKNAAKTVKKSAKPLEVFAEILRKKGFKNADYGCSRELVLIGRDYVVKTSFSIGSRPRRAIAQRRIKCGSNYLIVQPKVRINRILADERIRKIFQRNSEKWINKEYGEDLHCDNCGFLGKKLVVFDW